MNSLTDYITESSKQYEYRVKVAGELPTENLTYFKQSLAKFDLQSVTEPKTTPITKNPMGFPDLENVELNIFDIILNYPANSGQVIELARLAGIDPAKMTVVDKAWDESMQAEADRVEDTTRLETPEYPANTKEQTEASTKYSESFKDIVGNAASTEFEVAGGKTTPAKFNTDNDMGKDSPLSKVKRPSPEEYTK